MCSTDLGLLGVSVTAIRYLPGIKLPDNVIACSELKKTCDDATMLVFVVPHQVNSGPTGQHLKPEGPVFSHSVGDCMLLR